MRNGLSKLGWDKAGNGFFFSGKIARKSAIGYSRMWRIWYWVLRVRDILIRIRGSVPLTNGFGAGSGSCYFRQWKTFKMATKNNVFFHFCYYFLKLHFHFINIKSHQEVINCGNQGFSYYFCLTIEGFVPCTNGSGSGRPKNIRVRRIRIRHNGWIGKILLHEETERNGGKKCSSTIIFFVFSNY